MTTPPMNPERVIVVGGGLAGLTAALQLLERGVPVLLLEAHSDFLGGRTQALSPMRFEVDGRSHELSLDHGQHCLWAQYHNMRALLERYGLLGNLVSCDATQYVVDDGASVRRLPPFDVNPLRPQPTLGHFFLHLFQATHSTDLGAKDYARLLRALPKLSTALAFQHARDFEAWDRLSIAEFFDWCGVPEHTKLISHALQKASTFHSAYEMSAAWALSMLESTMLNSANDHKMWCFRGNLGTHLIDPLAARVRELGGEILLNASAVGINVKSNLVSAVGVVPTANSAGACGHLERLREPAELACQSVICATDIPGLRRFLLRDLGADEAIRAVSRLETLSNVTVRVVTKNRIGASEPWLGILAGGRFRVLDDYFVLSRYQDEFIAWSEREGGEVIELHSYFGHSELDLESLSEDVVRSAISRELCLVWPDLERNLLAIHAHKNPQTFDKQAIGHSAFQPRMQTSLANLLLCGSFVRTDAAVHDMEKAVTTGMHAANAILESRKLAPWQIRTPEAPSPLQRLARRALPFLPLPRAVRRFQSQRPA